MLGWHRQLARISSSGEQLADFQGSEENGKRGTAVIYSLTHLFFSLYSSHQDYQMQIIYRMLSASPFSALVHESQAPLTFPKPGLEPKSCTPCKPQFEKWISLHNQRGHLLGGMVMARHRPSLPRARQAALPNKPPFFCWCSNRHVEVPRLPKDPAGVRDCYFQDSRRGSNEGEN